MVILPRLMPVHYAQRQDHTHCHSDDRHAEVEDQSDTGLTKHEVFRPHMLTLLSISKSVYLEVISFFGRRQIYLIDLATAYSFLCGQYLRQPAPTFAQQYLCMDPQQPLALHYIKHLTLCLSEEDIIDLVGSYDSWLVLDTPSARDRFSMALSSLRLQSLTLRVFWPSQHEPSGAAELYEHIKMLVSMFGDTFVRHGADPTMQVIRVDADDVAVQMLLFLRRKVIT